MQATNQEDTMSDDTMIEDLQYMNIDEDFSEFDDDHFGGGEIREDETLLKEIIIWSVNLKGAPLRIRHLETALRLAPENDRPLVLAIQDLPNRLAFHNIPGYNIFFSSDHPITEKQYPTRRNGASATGNNATANAATNAATSDGTGPPAIAAEPLMHSVCFYVYKSIPTTSWRAIMDTGDNNGLVATLQILTARYTELRDSGAITASSRRRSDASRNQGPNEALFGQGQSKDLHGQACHAPPAKESPPQHS
ncbi:hypothetical protein FDENT_948 [Fusarium denticulatum]|uniref:Uncharacterized protein n=1 Tax=Fusarium denticulatum TaxID=48507 RepID=A0A8H5XJ90_9HYPO|nr:hypothetical protein FDENT_948 [Fusarium denticulatum]